MKTVHVQNIHTQNTQIIHMQKTGNEVEDFDLKFYKEPDVVAQCLESPVRNQHKPWQAWAQGQKPRAIYDSMCPERFSARHFAEAQELVLPVLLERKLDGDATAYLSELLVVKDVKVCRIAGIYQEWQEFALDAMQVSSNMPWSSLRIMMYGTTRHGIKNLLFHGFAAMKKFKSDLGLGFYCTTNLDMAMQHSSQQNVGDTDYHVIIVAVLCGEIVHGPRNIMDFGHTERGVRIEVGVDNAEELFCVANWGQILPLYYVKLQKIEDMQKDLGIA